MDLDEAGSRAFFAQTPSGFVRQAPLFRQITELREQCNRYLAAFGLSPTARMRVKASDGGQMALPGIPEPANADGKVSLANFA